MEATTPLPPLPPPPLDEDTAFFHSVTPTVKNFSEDEKIEFRMGVLTLIKQIKEKRRERPHVPPLRSPHYTSTSYSYSNTSEYQNQNSNNYTFQDL